MKATNPLIEPQSRTLEFRSHVYLGFRNFAMLCTVFLSWLVIHNYEGFVHDGILYAGQAIHRLHPSNFKQDLFFQFGSQDNYTFFSAIQALAIHNLGLAKSSYLLLFSAHLLWISSATFLFCGLRHRTFHWLPLILLFSWPTHYGSQHIFHYAEGFLTARSFSEPFALFAIAFALRRMPSASIIAAAVATAIHPLMAFPAILFLYILFISRQLLVITVIGGALILGSFSQDSSLAGRLAPMDPTWLALSIDRSPFIFLSHWPVADFFEPTLQAAILLGAGFIDEPRRRFFWLAALGVWIICTALSCLTILWPSALLIQLQPWRGFWLVKVLAICAAGILAARHWEDSPLTRLLICATAAAACHIEHGSAFVAACALLILFAMHVQRRLNFTLSPPLAYVSWVALIAVALTAIAGDLSLMSASLKLLQPSGPDVAQSSWAIAAIKAAGWLLFPLLAVSIQHLDTYRPHLEPWVAVTLAPVASFAAIHWDHAAEADRVLAQNWVALESQATALLPTGRTVYWEGGLKTLWLGLHRGNYASFDQLAGNIFSRKTAIEGVRRLKRISAMGTADSASSWTGHGKTPKTAPTLKALIHVCHDPILDFVVIRARFTEGHIGSLNLNSRHAPDFQVYECSILREHPDTYEESK